MIHREIKQTNGKISPKMFGRIVVFATLFAFFILSVSALMNKYFDPSAHPQFQQLLNYKEAALAFYFLYAFVASIIIPIPTIPLDVVIMKLFDPLLTIPIRLIGGLCGASISYYLSRKYGRPLLKRWLSNKNYEFVEGIAENITWKQFFIVAIIPIVNAELMAFAGGLSALKYRAVMWSLFVAILYRLIFVYLVLKF